jgi:hypothetical protein
MLFVPKGLAAILTRLRMAVRRLRNALSIAVGYCLIWRPQCRRAQRYRPFTSSGDEKFYQRRSAPQSSQWTGAAAGCALIAAINRRGLTSSDATKSARPGHGVRPKQRAAGQRQSFLERYSADQSRNFFNEITRSHAALPGVTPPVWRRIRRLSGGRDRNGSWSKDYTPREDER